MAFTNGIVIFFRHMMPDKTLARSVHPAARDYHRGGTDDNDYIVTDEDGDILGVYPREWVAALLPLDVGSLPNATDKPQ